MTTANDLPAAVGMALGIVSQEWTLLGLGEDPSVAASSDLQVNVERISALMVIRIVGWILPHGTFPDLSTTSICRKLLLQPDLWPESVTSKVMEELKTFVHRILSGYNDVPYHNFEHCYHVTISCAKLLDMVVHPYPNEARPCTYGLRDDALMQLVMVFSALIHDVEHLGIPNRQLANEDALLAIRYNDTSIAEHQSLFIAFSELLKTDFETLRQVLFPQTQDYRRFRTAVINLVLTTDIASPERSQIGKSKWKEAFGDPYETVERKVMKMVERRASVSHRAKPKTGRRMSTVSIMSELTLESGPVPANLEDDESLSGTPETSDDEEDKPMKGRKEDAKGPIFRPPQTRDRPENRTLPRRTKSADMHSLVHSSSMRAVARISALKDDASDDESIDSVDNVAGMALKFHRRLSTMGSTNNTSTPAKMRPRLGLLRTVDLAGVALETYKQHIVRPSATGATSVGMKAPSSPRSVEEVDPLREAVVMETIMKAADVAHNMQGWDQMAKYSNRLFLELKRAYVQGRGDDPQNGWFPNQIGFLDAYLLPLARKLDDTGMFGDSRGAVFATIVDENKERWSRDGMELTARIILEGHAQYPEADSGDEGN